MGEQLIEFFRHVVQLALERIDIGNLVPAGFSFVTENRAVKLVGVFDAAMKAYALFGGCF